MLTNFIKITLRYLWRNKVFSALNYFCLTFGLTCSIIAVLFILNVLSYDKFHKNYDRLCSVEALVTFFNGDQFPKEYLSASLTEKLKTEAPEFQEFTRIAEREYQFTAEGKDFTGKGYYADSTFFDLFTFPIVRSDNNGAFKDPNSIMISERLANKFFKSTDCIGKTIVIKDETQSKAFKISGVFRDVKRESSLQFDFLIPFSKFLSENSGALETGASSNQIWGLLRDKSDLKTVGNKIKNLIKDEESTLNQELLVFPLKEKILYDYAGGKRVWAEMQNLVIVGSIGFAILLIACFNFINLSIAIMVRRYREAGIRKVSGSGKSAIVIQYLGETLVITFLSLISAIVLARIALTGFNMLFNQNIHSQLVNFRMILFFIAITLFTAVASGLLPALYLSSSKPVDVLKGRIVTSNSYSLFRQGLIVFQFIIPIILIISMIVIKVQDRYMRNYDVGVDKDRLIILENSPGIQKHAASFKSDLKAVPGIDAISFTNCIPSRGSSPTNEVSWEGKDPSEKQHFWCINTDYDYNKAVKVNIIKGRYFDPSFSADSDCYVINDVSAKVMKYGNAPGMTITVEGKKGTVIGVFNDFHVVDLAGPMVPTIIRLKGTENPKILIRFSSGTYLSAIDNIRKIYKNYEPEASFQPVLFRDLPSYSELNVPSNLVGIAFIIALVLACMGLAGLASFTSESRTKEIGIRKANGATTVSIVNLFLYDFTKWLLTAYVIAIPFAFLLGRMFLKRFNFHSSLPVWAFFAGPALAFIAALSTVFFQTWHNANRNPVKALRYE